MVVVVVVEVLELELELVLMLETNPALLLCSRPCVARFFARMT